MGRLARLGDRLRSHRAGFPLFYGLSLMWRREVLMGFISRGFRGRPRDEGVKLPPGQYLVHDFPVLSAGPTPRVPLDRWEFAIDTEDGQTHRWSWQELMALPSETPTVDLHCVTKWSKLGTAWKGVSLDTLFADVES